MWVPGTLDELAMWTWIGEQKSIGAVIWQLDLYALQGVEDAMDCIGLARG